jgi:hypothetical protein
MFLENVSLNVRTTFYGAFYGRRRFYHSTAFAFGKNKRVPRKTVFHPIPNDRYARQVE